MEFCGPRRSIDCEDFFSAPVPFLFGRSRFGFSESFYFALITPRAFEGFVRPSFCCRFAGAGKSIFRGIEAKQVVATPGCFADQSFGERANFRVFVYLVPRLVLDRVVENDFSEGNFFLRRVSSFLVAVSSAGRRVSDSKRKAKAEEGLCCALDEDPMRCV